MAYNGNIPTGNQTISSTTSQIQTNFSEIQTYLNVNHVDFDGVNQGKHKFVEFPVQATNPPIVFPTGEVALYSFLNTITAQNELYITKQNQVTTVQIPLSASVLSTTSAPANNSSGWTYLPSGILVKWGNASCNGNTNVVFPVSANIPVFNQVFSIQLTTYANSSSDTNTFVRLSNFVTTSFNCYGSSRTTATAAAASFQYLAIGY